MDLNLYSKIAYEVESLEITIIVNNAGVLHYGEFKDQDPNDVREGTIVNTYPYILLTRALLPKLQKR